jgi:hypothetical protein
LSNRPDILLIGADWRTRALLRAQLIEDGHEVVAVDDWPVPRQFFQPDAKPRATIVDLQGLRDPATVVAEVAALTPPDRTLIIVAAGTVSDADVRARGFHLITRPASVADVAAAAARLLKM